MPGFRIEGFRLVINTRGERGHRAHAHVIKAGTKCKVMLDETLTAFDRVRMTRRHVARARELVAQNFEPLMDLWNKYNGEE